MKRFVKLGFFAVVGVLLVCVVVFALGGNRRNAPTAASPTTAAQQVAAEHPTAPPAQAAVPAATDSPEPTAAPMPTSAPEPTAVPSIANVGDRVEANGIALTVMKVDTAAQIGSFQKADAGNIYVIVEVLIENVSADKAPYNPLYFKVKDSDGFEYNATINTGDQSLKSGDLAQGDKVRGTVAVEIKESAVGLMLEYKPIVFRSLEPIKISLE